VAFNFRNSDPDDNKAATPPLPPGTPEEIQPPAEPVTPEPRSVWNRQPVYDVPGMDWKSARRAALFAGLVGALGGFVQSGVFVTFWMLAAGGISITIYKRSRPDSLVTPVNGFRMGALTGFVGFLLEIVHNSLALLSSANRAELRNAVEQAFNNMTAGNPDAIAQQSIQNLRNWASTPAGLATMFLLAMALVAIFFVIIAGIGGSIGASLFGKHETKPSS
jgi:hypothetical protein